MKHLVTFLTVFLISPILLLAQLDDGSLISDDLFLKVTPGSAEFQGVELGECRTVQFDIYNIGTDELTIPGFYIESSIGDGFNLGTPSRRPFELDPDEFFKVRVDFCPDGIGLYESELVVVYGEEQELGVPLNGTAGKIYDMDWCEDFDDWETGEILGEGWNGSIASNNSVYVSSYVPSNYYQTCYYYELESKALMLRNLLVVDDHREPSEVITPGIKVSGENPVISWFEISSTYEDWWRGLHPRNIYISMDGHNWNIVDTYRINEMPNMLRKGGGFFRKMVYPLKGYIGQIIWWKFELVCENTDYWIIDNWAIDKVCVQQELTHPILKHWLEDSDFKGCNLGESKSKTISVTNVGGSVASIKSIELISENDEWLVADTNSYPIEIHDGSFAFAFNGTDRIDVNVTFMPQVIGRSNAKLIVKWDLLEDYEYEIPLSGEGISCITAEEAFIGENWSASQDSWFKYTADKYQIVNINSCHPNQEVLVDPNNYGLWLYEYAYDTWLYVYTDCHEDSHPDQTDPTYIAQNDNLEWDICPYNRAASGVTFAMNQGETVYIFWPWLWKSPHDDEGFYFNIEPFYPLDGDICEVAIPLILPVVNHFGTTVGFEDNYYTSPCCTQNSNYMDGNDKIYSITLENDGYLKGNILGAYGSIHVLDECPIDEWPDRHHCKAYARGINGGEFEEFIEAGTYYVIISSWTPPQTVDYLLNLSFRGLGVDDDPLQSSINVYPNPTNDIFTISISNTDVKNITLELIDISGHTVYRNQAKSVFSFTEEIDANSFARGIYYLRVNDGENIQIKKVVVQ